MNNMILALTFIGLCSILPQPTPTFTGGNPPGGHHGTLTDSGQYAGTYTMSPNGSEVDVLFEPSGTNLGFGLDPTHPNDDFFYHMPGDSYDYATYYISFLCLMSDTDGNCCKWHWEFWLSWTGHGPPYTLEGSGTCN